MKRTIIFFFTITMFYFTPLFLSAQAVFSVSEIDPSDFPTVRASFVALNGGGNSYANLTKDDFFVIDMGYDVSPTINVNCIDTLVDPAVSVILILDKSTSMNYEYENGETRWNWVKEGATSFIQTINLRNGSKVGLISFSKLAGIACPFTDNKTELLDSLDKIKVAGGTEYDPPILDYRFGAVNMFKKGSPDTKIRRIAIFLTDGDPNHRPSVDSIKKELNNANIQFYAITLGMPMNSDLEEISGATGGKSYAVFTKEELNAIYEYIAIDIQRKEICTLSWQAPYSCTEVSRYHDVDITFKIQNKKVKKKYQAPPNSVAYVELSEPFMEFGNPDINTSVDREITLTARNSDFAVSDANILPSTFFTIVDWDINAGAGSDPPFVIPKDSSRTLRVRFTQGSSKLYRSAHLIFDGTPCPPTIELIGGITQIRIVKPQGGEIYSTCDTVEIQWAGVEANKPVNLAYSSNNGTSWNSIANNVRGLKYNWKPPQAGTEYRVRATVAPISNYKWAQSIGGSENDVGTSIAVTKDNLFVYVTGGFEGTIKFGTKTITSRGAKDIFIAKYDSDGNLLWVETAGGPGYDSSNAVCVDAAGNAYITGVCYQDVKFGNMTPTIPIQGRPNCFVARYSPNGGSPVVAIIGANAIYTTFEAVGQRIRFREAEQQVDVRGSYLNEVQSTFGYSLPKVTVYTPFTAVFRSDLSFGPVSRGGPIYPDYSKNYSIDANGNRYQVGNFEKNISFGSYNLTSNGKQDIYINKFGGTPGSEDISDSTFSVVAPVINFNIQNVVFSETLLGISNDTVLTNQLCNVGSLPVEITNFIFTGTNANDFQLTSNPVSLIIQPGECIPLEIVFQPSNIGTRTAQLTISGSCAQDITMNLTGEGICGGESSTEIDFGKINLSTKKDSLITCMFKNTNPTVVNVKPNLTGPDANDFSIDQSSFFVESDSCLTLTVSFNPSTPGIKNAIVEFQLPNGCINPVTELKGEGVQTELSVNSIHWNDRRILTSNDSFVVVKNTSVLPAVVDSIAFQLPVGNEFKLTSPPSLPITIPAQDSLLLQINFTPPTEQFHQTNLYIYAQGNTTPLTATLDGNGILPKIKASWICDTATAPGDTSLAFLVVENPSKTADLILYNIDFRYKTGDFAWASGQAPLNEIVPKEGRRVFDVLFTPQGAGTRADLVDLRHDAASGPEIAPVADTTIDALCDGLGLTVVDSINFNAVLICDNYTLPLQLENTSWQSTINVTDVIISGNDPEYFTTDFSGSISVPPGNTRTLNITFTPDATRNYSADLILKTSIGYDIKVNLTGIGTTFYLSADKDEFEQEPGYPITMPVNLHVIKLANKTVPKLNLEISFNDKMLRYDRVTFQDIPNWTWNQPVIDQPGVLSISGIGNLSTEFNDKIFDVQWTVFLADVKESNINIQPIIEDCSTEDTSIAKVKYSPFCFQDGRLIVTSNTNYYLKTPQPNPVTENTNIKFGLGLEGMTSLTLYSTLGEIIDVYLNKDMKAGNYELNIPVKDIPSGNYILVLRSGHIVKIIQFIVVN